MVAGEDPHADAQVGESPQSLPGVRVQGVVERHQPPEDQAAFIGRAVVTRACGAFGGGDRQETQAGLRLPLGQGQQPVALDPVERTPLQYVLHRALDDQRVRAEGLAPHHRRREPPYRIEGHGPDPVVLLPHRPRRLQERLVEGVRHGCLGELEGPPRGYGGQAQDVRIVEAVGAEGAFHDRPVLGERAGLVEAEDVHAPRSCSAGSRFTTTPCVRASSAAPRARQVVTITGSISGSARRPPRRRTAASPGPGRAAPRWP
jgi:hypothetical protein